MKFFKKRKDKWTRVYLAGYQQGLHTSYCKDLFCSFDYKTCPNVKSFYNNLEAIQRVRDLHAPFNSFCEGCIDPSCTGEIIVCGECGESLYPSASYPCDTIKALEGKDES